MKCLKCGNENYGEQSYCSTCGAILENNNLQNMQNQPNKKTPIILFVIIGLLIVAIPIIFALVNKEKINENKTDNDSEEKLDKEDKTEKKYSIADAVTLVDGSTWHVMGYNENGQIILLDDELILKETGYGKSAAAEDQKYENSMVKDYLENTYLPSFKQSLTSAGGNVNNLKVRTLSLNDIYKYGNLSDEDFKSYDGKNECNNSISIIDTKSYTYVDREIKPYLIWGDETLNDWQKFRIMLTLTNDFWLMTNTTDRNCEKVSGLNYYGAYYVKASSSESTSANGNKYYVSYLGLKADTNGVSTSSGNIATNRGTVAGVRAVIEIDPSNIK